MNKEILKYKNIASIISILVLIFSITDLPYGYYVFLRWVVTLSAIFLSWFAYNTKKTFWFVLMVLIVILFNPIVPIFLEKGTWTIIDFIVAIFFLISIFNLKASK